MINKNIDGPREDAHPEMEAIHGFIDAGGIAHVSELREEFAIFKNSEFENIESLFNVMNMMIARKSEKKNLFPSRFREPIVGEIHIAY